MFTYKLKFDNGKGFKSTTENLDQTHAKVVKYIDKNGLKECLITCPNGTLRRVTKTGRHHWNHPGFEFD